MLFLLNDYMVKNILRFILGSYSVRLYSNSSERFITELIKNNIKIRNIKKLSNSEITFECYVFTLNEIKKLSSYDNAKYEIIAQKGLPSYINRYKKRYGLLVGALFFIIMLYLISLFVWDIRITGNDNISEQQILGELKKQGMVSGKLKERFNIKSIENGFLSDNPEISWISINLRGTVAFVEVREKKKDVKIIDTSKPSNIYASRDGVIASVTSYMGYKVVKVGDTVTAGDLIVSGDYIDKYGNEYKLHSYAKVMAYTTHSYSVTVPFKTVEQQYTGKNKKYLSLKLTRFVIPLYFNKKISYNMYSKNISVKKFRLTDSFVLPFSIQKTTYLQTEQISYSKTKDVALSEAYEKLDDIENNLVGIEVLDKSYIVSENDNGVTVKVILNCYEDIGIEKEIN